MTKLVGIVNFTSNSFSDGGTLVTPLDASNKITTLFAAGADLVDLGVQSTTYGAPLLSPAAEWEKLASVLPLIDQNQLASISIDSFNYTTMQQLVDLGIQYINDVSGGADSRILKLIAANPQVKYICMYSLCLPADQNIRVLRYQDIISWAKNKITECLAYGIKATQLIIDPGIGFVTNQEQSYQVIQNIAAFKRLGVAIYVGHSRKSFFASLNQHPPQDRDIETLAASMFMLQQDVDYLRVHNIAMHKRAFRVLEALIN